MASLMSKSAAELTLHSIDAVRREPLRRLWEGRIPLGKVSLLAGDPALGKSFVTLDLAARVSRGEGGPPERGLDGPAAGGTGSLAASVVTAGASL